MSEEEPAKYMDDEEEKPQVDYFPPLDSQQEPQQIPAQELSPEDLAKKKKKKRILIIVFAIVLPIVIVIGVIIFLILLFTQALGSCCDNCAVSCCDNCSNSCQDSCNNACQNSCDSACDSCTCNCNSGSTISFKEMVTMRIDLMKWYFDYIFSAIFK